MKIISNFKDYYDPMAALGIDEQTVFVRSGERTILPLTTNQKKAFPNLNHDFKSGKAFPHFKILRTREYLNLFWVIFIDKIYYFWIHESKGGIEKIIWDLNELKQICEGKISKYYKYPWDLLDTNFAVYPFDRAIDPSVSPIRENDPIIICDYTDWDRSDRCIIVNGRLVDINFNKIVDAQQAWQQISMFLTKPKVGEPTTDSEKTKLLQHGMDNWSFKRPNHPKKPRGKFDFFNYFLYLCNIKKTSHESTTL